MKKKMIGIALSCSFVIVTGICYSCSYKEQNNSALLVTDGKNLSGGAKGSSQKTYNNDGSNDKEQVSSEQKADSSTNSKLTSSEKKVGVTPEQKGTAQLIYVHVCGAVKQPGVYQAPESARIVDMIKLAGGLTKEAAGDYINQAQPVTDGERIYIPTKSEVKELDLSEYTTGINTQKTAEVPTGSSKKSNLVNINEATAEELMNLPGIGEAKAASIIEYRNSNGAFQSIEDLMKITGIKEGLFHQISSLITVEK